MSTPNNCYVPILKITELTGHSNRFEFQGLVASYSTFQQMWEVIIKKNEIEYNYRWFAPQ